MTTTPSERPPPKMIRSAQAARAGLSRAGHTVATALIGLGLVAVLVMGSWAGTHSLSVGTSVPPVSESILADEVGASAAGLTSGGDLGGIANVGAALCLLGAACALLLVIRSRRAVYPATGVGRVADIVREPLTARWSRQPVLTLTQLRISRT